MDGERLMRTRRWTALFGPEEITYSAAESLPLATSAPGEGVALVLIGEAAGGESRLIAGEEGGLACPDATGQA